MAEKIENVCGYSCTGCDHHGEECPGCGATKGTPFWTAFAGIDQCAIYGCCTTERKLPHCGKCPELMCGRYNRIYDTPGITDEEAKACLAAMERELRARK